ncbi:MAG: CCA tRNA nucleotidyltransferase [Bacteroidia bacterium]|nr:CCA tRNA nucleotidyltransferase [Bacteroidia bacterium]
MSSFLDHPIFYVLSEIGKSHNQPVYVVGGFIRDILLFNKAKKEVDIVVVGNLLPIVEDFARIFSRGEYAIYENFGTAMVCAGDYRIEFVSARKESYRGESRKPFVQPATLEEDQLRRDFTVNAFYLSLNQENFGTLIDPFNGQADLEKKILRTPTNPDITFSEDPLRMLRAVRFATQLDFQIAPDALESIKKNVERLKIVSQERITDEFNKIILTPIPSKGLRLLFDTRLLHQFFPELVRLQGIEIINGIGHKDNFYHTLKVLDNVAKVSDNLWLRWAAILHDIAKPITKKFDEKNGWSFHGHDDKGAKMVPGIFKRLRLPLNEKMKYVQKLVELHLRPIALVDEEVTDSAIRRLIVDAGEYLEDLLLLCKADITTRDTQKLQRYLANFEKVEQRIKEVEERDRLRNWQPPITGEMVMQYFNLKPGPLVGLIKNAVREAILEGEIPNEESIAYQYMIEKGKKILQEQGITTN